MSVGFVMLCHTALHRAAQVARHWAERDCPVVIHVDRRVDNTRLQEFQKRLEDLPNVRFCRRYACDWGTWSLVAAMQTASEGMLAWFPQVRHVYAASGSCMPLRPVSELRAYLDARPQTDFIESVTTSDVAWTMGGIDLERFTLHFPSPGSASDGFSTARSRYSAALAFGGRYRTGWCRIWGRNGGA